MKTRATLLFKIFFVTALTACGGNMLESTEDPDTAVSATRALEQKRPSAAIKTLEKALEKDSVNPTYLSLLSAAYAQRAGIEPLSLAEAMAAKSAGSALTYDLLASSDSLVSLFDVMPKATADTVSDIQKAVNILSDDLPRSDWLAGDSFKFAIYQTASLVMSLKILDSDGDGSLSTSEIMTMTGGGAIISQLVSAASVLGVSGSSAASQSVATMLEAQKSAIASADGTSDDEKLKAYLGKAGSTASGSTSNSGSTTLRP